MPRKEITPLIAASALGQTDEVLRLLQGGDNVNAQDPDNWTILHYAAKFGHFDMAKSILSTDAAARYDFALRTVEGNLPWQLARMNENHALAELLYEAQRRAPKRSPSPRSPCNT